MIISRNNNVDPNYFCHLKASKRLSYMGKKGKKPKIINKADGLLSARQGVSLNSMS